MNSQRLLNAHLTATLIAFLGSGMSPSVAVSAPGDIVRVAVGESGEGNGTSNASRKRSFSSDGRYIAFYSEASNLVPNDSNGRSDVFVRDQQTGAIELISTNSAGEQGNSLSYVPDISRDGRFASFESGASNLVPGASAFIHVYLRDRQTGITTLVGADSPTIIAAGQSESALSGDGRYVVFAAGVRGPNFELRNDCYVFDAETNVTQPLYTRSFGPDSTTFYCDSTSISEDGRFIAFRSDAPNIVSGDTNGREDIFLTDRLSGTTERVNLRATGEQSASTTFPGTSLSDDGRFVTFHAVARDFIPTDSGVFSVSVLVKDRATSGLARASIAVSGAAPNDSSLASSMSGDGRFVAFMSRATNLVAGDSNNAADVFIRDLQAGVTARVSVAADGTQANGATYSGSLDKSGKFIALTSEATNMVSGDSNGAFEVFVKDASDLTPPRIEFQTSGAQRNGFFVGDAAGSWAVTDAESSTDVLSGCEDVTVVVDGFFFFECSAVSAGGFTSVQGSIFRDTTPPSAFARRFPEANASGWNRTDVYVYGEGEDLTSGLDACTDGNVSSEGADQEHAIDCTDYAGNVSPPALVTGINIDKTVPVVTAVAAPSPNGAGWNTTAVIVSFSGTDALSGIDPSACTAPVTLSTNGAGGSASGSCTDRAGNSGSATASGIDIDTLPPQATATPSPQPNANGWNNTNVTVTFAGTDSLSGSGLQGCSAPVTVTAEAAAMTVGGNCSDVAGNTSTTATATVSIDKTGPLVQITTPSGGSYVQGTAASASYACTDGLSGVTTCVGPVGNGGPIDTGTVGVQSFIVNAVDAAGNSASGSAAYTVTPSIDTTPPVIQALCNGVTCTPTWYNSAVALSWVVTDFQSTITSTSGCGARNVLSTPAGGRTYTCSAQSTGGMSSMSINVKADTNPPTIKLTRPKSGQVLRLNRAVTASYSCTDSGSGVANCSGTIADGGPIDVSTAGTKTFSVSATDNVGHSVTTTVEYTVQ
jgi:hypothetical protein